jgi:hypothetical protein
MSNGPWQYQVRVNLAAAFTSAVRTYGQGCLHPLDAQLKPLFDILTKYNARIENQFDAFTDFCRKMEAAGQTDDHVYEWTKAVVGKPGKAEEYATRFTIYADGGKEIYEEAIADALIVDLQPLVGQNQLITAVNKIGSNPAKNPQPPRQG